MLDKLKSKLRSSKSETQPPIETPLCPPPKYVDDNPMFPTQPSKHKIDESMGFVLGTEFPKCTQIVTRMPRKRPQ